MSNFHMSHYRRTIREFREEFGEFEGIRLDSPRATLAELLNPLWALIESYAWHVDDFIWSFTTASSDAEHEQLRSQLIEVPSGFVTDTATLIQYSENVVVNQGCILLGFAEMPDFESWIPEYYRLNTASALRRVFDEDIALTIYYVDGSPWLVFSSNKDLMLRFRDEWPNSEPEQLSDALLYSR